MDSRTDGQDYIQTDGQYNIQTYSGTEGQYNIQIGWSISDFLAIDKT